MKRPLRKEKKISEKDRLSKLLVEMEMCVIFNRERLARCQELAARKTLEHDGEKKEKNMRRLEEARRGLEESLILFEQISNRLKEQ